MTDAVRPIEVRAAPGVRAVFTTRAGGVSVGSHAGLNVGSTSGDTPDDVRENRARLAAALGVDADRVTMGHQVHGADVHAVDGPTSPGRYLGELSGWAEGDGLVTRAAGLPLMVLGADCLPVLLWRTDGSAVAAVHAGWRGLVAGILRNAVEALGGEVGVAVGPGVRPCCYPVDAELRRTFADRFGDETVTGDAVDLAAAARIELVRAGVADDRVETTGACTSCDAERFFSYRRDGERTGRQAGIIWRDA